MNVSTWFEIPVTDMSRAQAFYESTFNVSLDVCENMGLQSATFPFTEGGNCGSLTLGDGYNPSADGVVIYLMASDGIDATISRAIESGADVILSRTELPETDAGYIALIVDSEGNKIGLHGQS